MDKACESEFKELNLEAKIILSSWYGLAGLAAIIGNAIVLWLVARNKSLRTISNLFLASLAAADFFVGLVIDPVWIFTRCVGYDANTYVQTSGKVIDYLWIHTTVATTFNLCCVTMDRYLAILHPLRYQDILTKRRCYLFIATVWFISFILPCSRFFVKDGSVALWLSFTIITVLIPMINIIFCSIRILKAAAAQSKKIRNNYTLQSQEALRRGRKNSKAAWTIGIVVGLFVFCWLPSLITSLVNYFTPRKCGLTRQLLYYTVWTSVEALAFTSSGINPWVYCLRYEEFFKALTHTFPCVKRRNLEEALSHPRARKQGDTYT
ncbi:5-hydroxytryptamine receptor 1B-like [Stylophora pistillata]|uniref:5-hydroxytryptamine receptor 1B-like n=1 Tax=Stylophora pistillata TaxID=50429 RepID=UPI000C051C82|nr:5-hydroxytryptamine receptor 1B-like [Stylophora pistillata]